MMPLVTAGAYFTIADLEFISPARICLHVALQAIKILGSLLRLRPA